MAAKKARGILLIGFSLLGLGVAPTVTGVIDLPDWDLVAELLPEDAQRTTLPESLDQPAEPAARPVELAEQPAAPVAQAPAPAAQPADTTAGVPASGAEAVAALAAFPAGTAALKPAAQPADPVSPAAYAPAAPAITGSADQVRALVPWLDLPQPPPLTVAALPPPKSAREEAEQLVEEAPLPPAAQIAALRKALGHLRRGEQADAERLVATVADPVAKSLLDWIALRSFGRAATFAQLKGFIDRHRGWPGEQVLRKRAENALYSERHRAETVLAFFAARKPEMAAGKIALATALLESGDKAGAAALVRDAWREDNPGAGLEAAILARFGEMLRPEDHRFRMERYLFRERFGDASRAAERLGKDYVALVRARQAVANKAANAQALLDAVPKALKSDTSFAFSQAQQHRRKQKPKDAAAALADVPADPAVVVDGDEWWEERRLIARQLLDGGDAKAAYAVAKGHAAETESVRVEAEFHAGWIALRFLDDPASAAEHFANAAEAAETPISLARAAFWRGRAEEARGRHDAARVFFREAARYPAAFYGQIARDRVGEPGLGFDRPSTPAAAVRRDVEAHPAVKALRLLYAVGEQALALRLAADAALGDGDIPLLHRLGDITAEHGDVRATLVLGKLATRRGLPLGHHAFPIAGIPEFTQAGEAVDPAIVYAIARQESAFDPAAVSHAGARGLMQLMPATARITAQRFGIPFALAKLTTDAAYNARIGTAHLSELLGDWRGSLILTFAAYNAGAGNVKKWIEAYGDPRDPGIDPIDWIERIPYTETRGYVQRVMENYQVYRLRLGSASAMSIVADLKRGTRQKAAGEAPPIP